MFFSIARVQCTTSFGKLYVRELYGNFLERMRFLYARSGSVLCFLLNFITLDFDVIDGKYGFLFLLICIVYKIFLQVFIMSFTLQVVGISCF